MNVVGISCSPRKGGNTDILVQEALKGANDLDAKTEFLTIRGRNIKPCDDCKACYKLGRCRIKDDMQEIYEKLVAADGIILGTPVYFWDMSGQAKILLDRTAALMHPRLKLANKVGGAIAVAARSGSNTALSILHRFFVAHHVFTAELVNGLAYEKGEILKDERGLKSAWELGRLIVLLMEQHFQYPEEFNRPLYAVVEEKHNIVGWPIGHSR